MGRVRQARDSDAAEMLDLHVASIRTFGPDAYDDDAVEAWAYKEDGPSYPIDNPDHVVVVAESEDGQLAGFGDVVPDEGALYAVYVHPDHARVGVGTGILERLEAEARTRGCETLELTASKNAVGFYERAGYDRIESVEHEPSGPHEVTLECVRMRKSLVSETA